MKRFIDVLGALVGLAIALPIIAISALLVWIEDRQNPLFLSRRVGRRGVEFRMVKIRTMRRDAESTGVHSTSLADPRLLRVGTWLRSLKFDELPQFWNVLIGQMSLVGPRPNVVREVEMYSPVERRLLDVRPGITDFASLVFADLGALLHRSSDPNRDYNLLVRPWKSRLGIHYVDRGSVPVDLLLVALTALQLVAPRAARSGTVRLLRRTGAAEDLVALARRDRPLVPTPPPGVSAEEWSAAVTYRSPVGHA